MDLSDVKEPIIIFILLLLSAFFTISESALASVNKLRIKTLADDNIKGSSLILKVLENPNNTIRTLVFIDTVCNMAISSIATVMALHLWGSRWIALSVCILTIFVIILGDIGPRTIGTLQGEKFLLNFIGPILFLTKLLTPIIFIVNKLADGYLFLLHIDKNTKSNVITEDELRNLLDYSHEEGVIESEERRMLTNIVDFGDSLAKDVMVPRIDMVFASIDFDYDELVQVFTESKYTRLPVYSDSRDNVIGIVNLKDVFFYHGDKEAFSIKDIIREPYYTYEYKKTTELLIEMRRHSLPISIVLDEYGATVGLITIEDLLEEIVGEIRDEYDDDEEDNIKAISDYEFIVDGNTKLDEINEALGLHLESDDYDSIAGHIIYLLDHLPNEGESVTSNQITFTVRSMDKNRIDKIHILIHREPEVETEE